MTNLSLSGSVARTAPPGRRALLRMGLRVRRQFTGAKLLNVLAPLLLAALLAFGWQQVAASNPTLLPPLPEIGKDLWNDAGFYWENMLASVTSALAGFAAGGGLAIVLAALVVRFDFIRAAVMPVALLLNVTPIVAIAPALVVAFGFNKVPTIIVAAIMAFFPMLINAITGLRSVDQQALELMQAMSASSVDIMLRLRVPSSLPFLFAGARLSMAAAMVGAVVAEFFGATQGLGAVIMMASSFLNVVQMWGAIFVAAACALVLLGILGLMEKLVVRW